MALALYRKYRPRTFAEVIGQEHVTEPLSQALRSGRLHHAYLFSGPRGCGKTSSARILARSLNCEQGPTPEPCGVCASCRSLANDGGGSIDVIEIDAASHGGVDDARDLREKAFFAPASSRYKIYVIDEAHMVSSAGFNALLKLVEEPPDYVKFIFATTEPEKVLGTIKSRTHHYPFRLIPPAVLRPYLQQLTEAEGAHVDPAVFPLVVRAGGGSARDSLSVLDQLIAGAGPEGVTYRSAVSLLGVTDVALIDEMCDALAAGDGATAYATIDRVAEAGHDARRFASDLLERFRDLIILQQVPDAVSKGLIDGPADQLDAMSAQALRLGPATLSRCADIVHNGLVEMRGTTAPRLLLELITARMLLPGADDSTGALLQRLERMERRLTLTGDTAGPSTPANPDSVRPQPSPASLSGAPAAQAPTTLAPDAGDSSGNARGAASGGASGNGISAARAAAAAAARRAPAEAPAEGVPRASAQADPTPPAEAQPGVPAEAGDAPVESGSAATTSDGVDDKLAPDGESGEVATRPASGVQSPPSASREDGDESGWGQAAPPPQTRRPEPAGILPDAPDELSDAASVGVPGQLSAASIREVWPEIITAVGRQSKKIAALASGATVRDLDGETVVLTFRFPAHAKMVAASPDLITNALYEALGGRWQLRCEVTGDAAGGHVSSGAPARRPAAQATPARAAPAQSGSPSGVRGTAPADGVRGTAPADGARGTAPADGARGTAPGQREAASAASAPSGDDDDWPEPARPGGAVVSAVGPDPEPGGGAALDSPGGGGKSPAGRSVAGGRGGNEAVDQRPEAIDVPRGSDPAPSGSANKPPADSGTSRSGGTGVAGAVEASAGGVGRTSIGLGNGGPGSGRAAARAAAAGARTGAPARPGGRPSEAENVEAPSGSWSDGSASEEPPYDPEYDGPVPSGAAATYDGFDPGDEPLDDVIDAKTARQSSEQQAMQLLQDAFGAEKIGES